MLVLRTPWIRELASWRSVMWRYNKQKRYDLKILQKSKRKDEEGKKNDFPYQGILQCSNSANFSTFGILVASHWFGFAQSSEEKNPKEALLPETLSNCITLFLPLILFQNYSLAPPVLEEWYFTLSIIPIHVLPCRSASQKVVSKWLNRVMSWQSYNLPELEIIQPFALQQKPDRFWLESQHKPVSH